VQAQSRKHKRTARSAALLVRAGCAARLGPALLRNCWLLPSLPAASPSCSRVSKPEARWPVLTQRHLRRRKQGPFSQWGLRVLLCAVQLSLSSVRPPFAVRTTISEAEPVALLLHSDAVARLGCESRGK
jgi:hypothetical protein